MSSGVVVTGILVGGIVLIIAMAILATPSGEKRSQHPCYFAGVHVALGDAWHTFEGKPGVPAGQKIGEGPCSGPPEYSYAVLSTHPAHVIQGVKICPAHVGALQELVAALDDGIAGYWVIPND